MMRNLYLVLALCLFFPVGLFAQVDTLQTVVYFDVGQSTLRADARARLDALLQRRGGADWVRVELTGRTDHDGDPAANERLAQRRIASVQAYLFQNGGLAAEICGSQAKGEADPLADNATPAGKSINRSVRIDCQVRRRPAMTSIPSTSLSDAVPLVQPLDTVKANLIPCFDADCRRDTTIVLPQGTRLVFNRCEYLRLQPCLEFEEALSAREALENGLTTMDSQGRALSSCGMIRITLRPGCSPDECFNYPVKVRSLVPKPECNPCSVMPPTLFELSRELAWQSSTKESPQIELVKEKGKEYYAYELRCPGNWKNCDCLPLGIGMKFKAPRKYIIRAVTLSMECPMVVVTRDTFNSKRPNIARFKVPCPNSKIYLSYTLLTPAGDTLHVKRHSTEKMRARKKVRDCGNPRGKRIRRVLGIFPVYRHALYHKYFLVAKKDRIRR